MNNVLSFSVRKGWGFFAYELDITTQMHNSSIFNVDLDIDN